MHTLTVQPSVNTFSIALVVSRYNVEITDKLLSGALERLNLLNFTPDQITVVKVPGAVEIPITAQRLARTGSYAAIICLGAVIYGETPHFDYVCQQVSYGCQQVALTHDIPVIFGVLTTHTLVQATERVGGTRGHMGCEAVNSAVELVAVLTKIK